MPPPKRRPRANPSSVDLAAPHAEYDAVIRTTLVDVRSRVMAFKQRAPYARWDAQTWPRVAEFVGRTMRDALALTLLAHARETARAKFSATTRVPSMLPGTRAVYRADYEDRKRGLRAAARLYEKCARVVEKRLAEIVKDETRTEVLASRIYWNAANGANAARAKRVDGRIAAFLGDVDDEIERAAALSGGHDARVLAAEVMGAMGRPVDEGDGVFRGLEFYGPEDYDPPLPHSARLRKTTFVSANGLMRGFGGKFKPTSKKDL